MARTEMTTRSSFAERFLSTSLQWRPVVLGGVDGIITSVAILSGSFLSKLTLLQTISVALSTVIADAVSMAASEYLSSSQTPEERKDAAVRGAFCGIAFLSAAAIPLGVASASHGAREGIRLSLLIGSGLSVASLLSFARHRVFKTSFRSAAAETLLLVGVGIGVAIGTNLAVQGIGAEG